MLGVKAWLCDPGQRPPSLVLPRRPCANGLSVSLLPAAYSTPGTSPANRSFVGLGPRDPTGIYQAQVGAKRPAGGGVGGAGQRGRPGRAGRGRPAGSRAAPASRTPGTVASLPAPSRASSPRPGTWYGPKSCQGTLLAELLWGWGFHRPGPICTYGKTEARRGKGICPGSHSASAQAFNPPAFIPSHAGQREGPQEREVGGARGPQDARGRWETEAAHGRGRGLLVEHASPHPWLRPAKWEWGSRGGVGITAAECAPGSGA